MATYAVVEKYIGSKRINSIVSITTDYYTAQKNAKLFEENNPYAKSSDEFVVVPVQQSWVDVGANTSFELVFCVAMKDKEDGTKEPDFDQTIEMSKFLVEYNEDEDFFGDYREDINKFIVTVDVMAFTGIVNRLSLKYGAEHPDSYKEFDVIRTFLEKSWEEYNRSDRDKYYDEMMDVQNAKLLDLHEEEEVTEEEAGEEVAVVDGSDGEGERSEEDAESESGSEPCNVPEAEPDSESECGTDGTDSEAEEEACDAGQDGTGNDESEVVNDGDCEADGTGTCG